jgi:hypothetical protein
MLKTYDAKFPPPPLQVSAVSCVWEESLWYTYNRRRHMNINGFPIGCRQIFCPRQPIECFVSKRHYSNVTDRKGFNFDAHSDPTYNFDADSDPDSAPHQSDANLWPLVYITFTTPFDPPRLGWASTALHAVLQIRDVFTGSRITKIPDPGSQRSRICF